LEQQFTKIFYLAQRMKRSQKKPKQRLYHTLSAIIKILA
jgi:hypothetical protein